MESLTPRNTPSGQITPSHPTLVEAKRLIESQQADAAIVRLKKFITTTDRPSYLAEAYLLLSSALMSTEKFEQAATYLERLLNDHPDSGLRDRARLLLASVYSDQGKFDQALPLLSEVRSLASDTPTRREALTLMGELLAKKRDFLRAVQAWLENMNLAPEDQRSVMRARIRELVMTQMDRNTLGQVRDTYLLDFPGDLALIRLADLHRTRNEQYLAERDLRLFLKRFPDHEYAATAADLLESFSAQLQDAQHILAAVLPLSGPLEKFGTESLRGIQLALEQGQEEPDFPTISLAITNTESDPMFLRSELYTLINRFRPLALIGPLRSRAVQKLSELAERTETPLVTPAATLPNLRALGSYLFSTAVTYQLQAHRIADFAIDRLHLSQFCILHPNTLYGRELARLFQREVGRRGGEIVAVESYKEKAADFGPQLRRLKAQDLARDGIMDEVKTRTGEPRDVYTPGFDALFIPGQAKDVALISAQLVFFDMKTTLLGTNLWNSPTLLQLADRSIDGSAFVESFYLGSEDPTVQDFIARYNSRYQHDPSMFAAQAFDAANVVLEAIRRGATSPQDVREALVNGQAFPALGGPAGFDGKGVLARHLVVLQVKDRKIQPAPPATNLLEPASTFDGLELTP